MFISHISEERAVAKGLKKAITQDFLNLLTVFSSDDGESVAAGEDWLKSIDEALRNASILITLCSPASKYRPWIHFEAGAAWMRRLPLIPLCHAGLTTNDLPMPLSTRQGIPLTTEDGVRQLYERLADLLACACPQRDFAELANELSRLEVRVPSGRLEDDRGVQKRLHDALTHGRYQWRSLERVAIEAGVSEEVAADMLRADEQIRFSKGKTGQMIVGLVSRVGPGN